jgi:dTDP-4-dehydrorhamnose reductase
MRPWRPLREIILENVSRFNYRSLMPLAWITGARGLIGNYLVETAPLYAPTWRVRGLTRDQLDLLDFDPVRREFGKDKPDLVVHCAAMSQSPECQKHPELAQRVNVDVTTLLAELAVDIPFFFFSSDLVFDGQKGNYSETDVANPLSIYGETKLTAEKVILANPKHTVIRTSLNGGTSPSGSRGFNEVLRLAFSKGQKLTLFTDEFRSPIPADATARAVWELALRRRTGLYHVAGAERLSRYQMGQLIAERWPQLNPRIEAESLRSYQGAPRSPDTSLNCAKAQALLSFPLPGLSEWLVAHPAERF